MDKSKSPSEYISCIKLKPPYESISKYTAQKAKLLILNPKFQQTVQELRKEFKIPLETGLALTEHEEEMGAHLTEEHIPLSADWSNAMDDILERCGMLPGWRDGIQTYILHNIFFVPPSLEVDRGIDISHSFGVELKIRVNDYSSTPDIKFINNLVRIQRIRLGYQRPNQAAQPIRNLEHYMRMLEYKSQNFTDEEIAKKVNNDFAQAYTTKEVHDKLAYTKKHIDSQMS